MASFDWSCHKRTKFVFFFVTCIYHCNSEVRTLFTRLNLPLDDYPSFHFMLCVLLSYKILINRRRTSTAANEIHFKCTYLRVRTKSSPTPKKKNERKQWIDKLKKWSRKLLPSPSASSKFGSSILKFFKHAQFFMYTQNHFGILKS